MIEKVTEIIVKTAKCDAEDVTLDADLMELGITSLDTITMLFEMEEAFDIDIPNEVIPSIVTVGDIIEKLEEVKGVSS